MPFARSAMPSTAAPARLSPSTKGWFEMMAWHKAQTLEMSSGKASFRRMRQRALQMRSRAALHRVHLGRRQSDLLWCCEPRAPALSTARESRSLGKLVEDVGVLVYEVDGYGNHIGLGDSGCRRNCDPGTIAAGRRYGFAGTVDLGCYAREVILGLRKADGGCVRAVLLPWMSRIMARVIAR